MLPTFRFHCSACVHSVGQEKPTERDGPDGKYMSSIDGLIVRKMIIKNAGGECIRLRCECVGGKTVVVAVCT